MVYIPIFNQPDCCKNSPLKSSCSFAPYCHFTVGSDLKPFVTCGEGAQEIPIFPPLAPLMPPEPVAIPVVGLSLVCSPGLL